jgi:hypothetical protein
MAPGEQPRSCAVPLMRAQSHRWRFVELGSRRAPINGRRSWLKGYPFSSTLPVNARPQREALPSHDRAEHAAEPRDGGCDAFVSSKTRGLASQAIPDHRRPARAAARTIAPCRDRDSRAGATRSPCGQRRRRRRGRAPPRTAARPCPAGRGKSACVRCCAPEPSQRSARRARLVVRAFAQEPQRVCQAASLCVPTRAATSN